MGNLTVTYKKKLETVTSLRRYRNEKTVTIPQHWFPPSLFYPQDEHTLLREAKLYCIVQILMVSNCVSNHNITGKGGERTVDVKTTGLPYGVGRAPRTQPQSLTRAYTSPDQGRSGIPL